MKPWAMIRRLTSASRYAVAFILLAAAPLQAVTPPTVTMTNPPGGSVGHFPSGIPIFLAATAIPGSSPITSVKFLNGTTVIAGTVSNFGTFYSLTWTPSTPGTYIVTARATAGGVNTSSLLPATIIVDPPAPTITSINPTTKLAGSPGFSMIINGTNFVNPTTVVVWGSSFRQGTVTSSTRLTVNVSMSDVASAGTVKIAVANDNLTSAPVTFTITNPAPVLSSLSQASAPQNGAGFTLTLTGSGFNSSSVINWGASARTPASVTATALTLPITAADLLTPGTVSVKVTNPTPGGGTSAAKTFTIIQANNPVPVLTSLSPSPGISGGPAFTLTATGSGFVPTSVLRWKGSDRPTTPISATQLSAAITAPDIAAAGTASITIFNPTPGGGTSQPVTYAINNPLPVLSSLSQTSAAIGDAPFTMTLTGSGFMNASVVHWNAVQKALLSQTPTQLTVAVTAADLAATGTDSITVSNPAPGGGTSTPALIFSVNNPLPVVTSLSRTQATAGDAAFNLDINGSGFLAGSVVNWGSATKTPIAHTAAKLTISLSNADLASGASVVVKVTNPAPGGGTSTTSQTFTINNPLPVVTSLSSNNAFAGSGPFDLDLNGSGFVPTSVVNWGGVSKTPISSSASKLTVAITAADVASAGTVSITVTNAGPGGGTSAPAQTFIIANALPVLNILSPASVSVGDPPFTLTLTGSGFSNSSVVNWNTTTKTPLTVSATQLTIAVVSADFAVAGPVSVTVTNPAPGGGTSAPVQTFSVLNPVPFISALNPTPAIARSRDFNLKVSGTKFMPGAVVRWNGQDRPTTVSGNDLVAAIPASDVAIAGSADITVFNPSPGGGVSNFITLPILNPVAVISAITPSSVTARSGGFNVTVTGTLFATGAVVRWNGQDRITTISGNDLIAVIPANDIALAGSGVITVFNPLPGGGLSNPVSLSILNPLPTISTITPATVIARSGDFNLTVSGTFAPDAVVRWNGQDRPTTLSGSDLVAAIPAADIALAGSADITVFNPLPGGGVSAVSQTLTINNPLPTITALNQTSANVNDPAIPLTVSGTLFAPGAVIRWNGQDLPTTVSGADLTTTIQASSLTIAGIFPVTVFNPPTGGGPSNAINFTVLNPAPLVTGISPDTLMAHRGPFTLTVSGSQFAPGAVIRWNGQDRATVAGAGQLQAMITNTDLVDAGPVPITVFNPGPGGGVSAAQNFTITLAPEDTPKMNGFVGIQAIQPLQSSISVDALYWTHIVWRITSVGPGTAGSPGASGTGSARTGNIALDPISTLKANLDFGTLPIVPGTYHIQATAVNDKGRQSDPAETTVTLVSENLDTVHIFPNPWRSDVSVGFPITFDHMTANSVVKIFTIAGHWVRTLPTSNQMVTWDLKNDAGDLVASGIYIYLITNDQGQKTTGKIAIAR